MSERPEEPDKASDGESLLPIDEHIEEGHGAEGRKVRHRSTYLLPNLFTTAVLSSGFYVIINGMNGQSVSAVIAIFMAIVPDGLDGCVARLTNIQSVFSAEYDSLSDMVVLGVAPALVAFEWALGSLSKVGWAVAFIYVAGAALCLTRFSTQVGKVDKRYLIGLVSPAAAVLVVGTVWAFSDFETQGAKVAFLVALLVAAAGMLMVSNTKYHSLKDPGLRDRVPLVAILIVVLASVVAFTDPLRILLLLSLAYVASGPVQYLPQLRCRKQPS